MNPRTIKIILIVAFFIIFMVGFVLLAKKGSQNLGKKKLTKDEKLMKSMGYKS